MLFACIQRTSTVHYNAQLARKYTGGMLTALLYRLGWCTRVQRRIDGGDDDRGRICFFFPRKQQSEQKQRCSAGRRDRVTIDSPPLQTARGSEKRKNPNVMLCRVRTRYTRTTTGVYCIGIQNGSEYANTKYVAPTVLRAGPRAIIVLCPAAARLPFCSPARPHTVAAHIFGRSRARSMRCTRVFCKRAI